MTKFILRYRYFILAFIILAIYLIHSRKINTTLINLKGKKPNTDGYPDENNTGLPPTGPGTVTLEDDYETDSDPILNNSQVLFITTDVNKISVSVSGGKIYPAGTTVRMIDDTHPIWWYVRTPDGLEGYMLASYISK